MLDADRWPSSKRQRAPHEEQRNTTQLCVTSGWRSVPSQAGHVSLGHGRSRCVSDTEVMLQRFQIVALLDRALRPFPRRLQASHYG